MMKKISLSIIAFFILFIGCISESNEEAHLDQEIQSSCLSSHSLNIEVNNVELYKFGIYHNEILDSLSNYTWGRNCGNELITAIDAKIKDIINNNNNYLSVFGSPSSSLPLDYDILLDYCQTNIMEEVDNLNKATFNEYLDVFEDESLFSNVEQEFILRFFDAINPDNAQSVRPKVNLDAFYAEVLNSNEDFLQDGAFSLMLLVIYDHSSCFWMDYFTNNDVVQPRSLGFLAGLAVGDAVSAYVGGIKNLIRTNGEYDSNDDLFVSMGNAALNGSSFGILPW